MEILQVNMALPVQDNKNNDCNQIIDHGDKTKCPYKIFQPYISCCFKKKFSQWAIKEHNFLKIKHSQE